MTEAYFWMWVVAFAQTQMVELPIYVSTPTLEGSNDRRIAIGFMASAITHPCVWFVIPPIVEALALADTPRGNWYVMVVVAETFAWWTEAAWLRLFGVQWRTAILWALFANAGSFLIGLFLSVAMGV